MFGTIRKHQTWLWTVIIALTVLSFVVYFSPTSQMGGGDDTGTVNLGSVNGQKVSREAYLNALREVNFRYFLNRGAWPDRDPGAKQANFNAEREVYYRLLLLQKAQELGIAVSAATAAELAANILRQSGLDSLQLFEQRVLAPNLTIADLERFTRDEIAIQQLVATVGLPGTLLTPQEAKLLYQYDNQEVSAQVVYIPASNYVASVPATPEALQQFFTSHTDSYRVPAQIQVKYVKYEATNYWSLAVQTMDKRITNYPAAYAAIYEQRGTNYFKGRALHEVTNEIYADLRRNFALDMARTNAAGLLYEISELEVITPAALDKSAKTRGLGVRTTTPFDNVSGPRDLQVPATFVQKAFTLTDKEPVGGPILAEDGVYVIGLATNIPSYIPPFSVVANRVRADFIAQESNRLARQAGEAFQQKLTNSLAAGKTFASLCLEAGFRPTALSAFSRSSRSIPEFELAPASLVQESAFKLPPGKVSDFIALDSGGFILQVKELLPLSDKHMQETMPRFLTALRQNGQSEVFNGWFRKQVETGLRDTPLNRPTPPALSGGPRR
jgi:hypothetical protein